MAAKGAGRDRILLSRTGYSVRAQGSSVVSGFPGDVQELVDLDIDDLEADAYVDLERGEIGVKVDVDDAEKLEDLVFC